MNIARLLASCIPPEVIRWCGRQQFEYPALGPLIRLGARLIRSGVAKIQHGPGKGLFIDASLGFSGYALGTTEPEEQLALQAMLSPGDSFWNVGANIGFHAILGARFVGGEGRVVAFEPAPDIAQMAVKNARLNHFNHVTVVRKAVSDSSGKVHLFFGDASAVNTIVGERSSSDASVEVDSVTLDDYLQESDRPPNVISIDVEGAELQVLTGALKLIRLCKPRMLLELHWLQKEFYQFHDQHLAGLGYGLFDLNLAPYFRKPEPIREHLVISLI